MQEKKPRTTTASSRYSLGEAASRFEGSERDVVSETGAVGKLCPGMGAQSGMQFPRETRCGNGIPESALKTGRSFRKEVLGKTVPRFDPKYWDIVSLS